NHFLFRRQHVIRIHKFLRLDNDRAFYLTYFHEVSNLQAEFITNVLWDHDLAALAELTDGHNRTPSFHCTTAVVHTARLSDDRGLSTHRTGAYRSFKCYCATVPWGMHLRGFC